MMDYRTYGPRCAAGTMLIACLAASCLPPSGAIAADPTGAADFKSRCGGCHSIRAGANGIGPSLAGVYGRSSGGAPGYHYSPALGNAKLVWNDQSLNKFLQGPNSVVPGTKMFVNVPNAATRQQIIDYLKNQKQQAAGE
jgi:cytochrome c